MICARCHAKEHVLVYGLHVSMQSIQDTAGCKLKANTDLFLNDTKIGMEYYSSTMSNS